MHSTTLPEPPQKDRSPLRRRLSQRQLPRPADERPHRAASLIEVRRSLLPHGGSLCLRERLIEGTPVLETSRGDRSPKSPTPTSRFGPTPGQIYLRGIVVRSPRRQRCFTSMAAKYPLVVFFALAYAWAWLVYVPMVIVQAAHQWIFVATLGPTLAAVITHRAAVGNYQAFRFRTTWLRTLGRR